MLVFDILEATRFDTDREPTVEPGDSHTLSDLAAVASYLSPRRIQECLNDATYYRGELRAQFAQGRIGLREMARGERIFLYAIGRIKEFALAQPGGAHEDVDAALDDLADIYHGNFSLFQSLPDMWAIDQLHPIAPLQRLNEAPDRRALLKDGVGRALPVHGLREGERYYLGVFFVGAYQETLGDLHNLFGDTNVVTIALRGDGGFDLIHEVEGDTIGEVLSYVEYQPVRMLDAFKSKVEAAVSRGALSTRERRATIATFKAAIGGTTYYEG
jgi:arginine decarboxylase